MSDEKDSTLSRRDLLKAAGLAGIGLSTANIAPAYAAEEEAEQLRRAQQRTMIGVRFEPHDVVRLGIIGVGLRGTDVLREFLAVDKVVVNAVCDVVKEKCTRAAQMIEKAGQKTPGVYANGERDFERLVSRDDLDFVYIATPWEWHVPQVLAALRAGKHVGTEVPTAYTLEDCWNIVDASERARRQ